MSSNGDGCGLLRDSPSMEIALQNAVDSINGSVESEIARTAISIVYRVTSKKFRRIFAIKIINTKALPKPIARKFLPRELLFTRLAQHPHIARALSIRMPNPTKITIISDYYPGGTLLDLIVRYQQMPEYPLACRLFRQLTEAIRYLHDRGVVHRDIKPDNVLLDANEDVKLADFGFARYINRRKRSYSFCGTKPYCAPEIIQHKPYDAYASDWYSMGVLLYTMLVGKWPQESHETDEQVSCCATFETAIPSQPARALIIRLMNTDYRFRGNYDTIINSEWMKAQKIWVMKHKHLIYEIIKST
ncbi:unnamed protein product [Thelazia callipaeda]|uniref:Protein kinase domain-containing protein n=1 Tax=Thelazia callipaeda TaxID=103827 RepID=A0A0N5D3X0_THECL|nr:unnamed protein product [Thelazia callipaeda]